ncbi:MAG: hypothetical protein RBR67_18960 [Desulfobacterium sp.]|nr:hypothetical protein [Desulfobacterium sp.]
MFFTSRTDLFTSKWLIPSLGVLPFLILPVTLLFAPDKMLRDPGVGWHLAAGHYMLDHLVILDHDIFSFSQQGQPWVTMEWLFQCFAATLDKIGGLPLVSVVAALIYGSLPIMLYKNMIKKNVNIYLALVMIFVVFFGLSGHCHARPHIFTYFFFIILTDKVFSYDRNEISTASLFSFIPVMIFWCNLHGGFLVAIACAGLAFLVSLYQFLRFRQKKDRDKTKVFFLLGLGITLATLVNPLGWNLHISLFKVLSSDLLHQWNEFASPDFNSGSLDETLFLFLILGFFLILYWKKNEITVLEITFLLFFLYQSLHAVRHMFLFFLLAIPIMARELTDLISSHDNRFTRRSEMILAEQKQIKGDRIYIPIMCGIFIILSLAYPTLFKNDFYSSKRLTSDAGRYIEQNMDRFKRPFNTMDIGGALIYHFWPGIHVFADDRLDYYGDDFFNKHYMPVVKIKQDWAQVLVDNQIDSAIITSTALAALLKESPDWEIVFEEENSYVFERVHDPDL